GDRRVRVDLGGDLTSLLGVVDLLVLGHGADVVAEVAHAGGDLVDRVDAAVGHPVEHQHHPVAGELPLLLAVGQPVTHVPHRLGGGGGDHQQPRTLTDERQEHALPVAGLVGFVDGLGVDDDQVGAGAQVGDDVTHQGGCDELDLLTGDGAGGAGDERERQRRPALAVGVQGGRRDEHVRGAAGASGVDDRRDGGAPEAEVAADVGLPDVVVDEGDPPPVGAVVAGVLGQHGGGGGLRHPTVAGGAHDDVTEAALGFTVRAVVGAAVGGLQHVQDVVAGAGGVLHHRCGRWGRRHHRCGCSGRL